MDARDEDARGYEGRRVVAASSLGVFAASLVPYVFSVFLKPVAEEFSRRSLALPFHPGLAEESVERVVSELAAILGRKPLRS